MTFSPSDSRLLLTFRSIESTAVKTAIMAKIPMVIPNSDNVVRSRLTRKACKANDMLSRNSVRKNMAQRYPFRAVSGTITKGRKNVLLIMWPMFCTILADWAKCI